MSEIENSVQLEQLRKRLLDLTLRNRLLNYPHPKGRSLRFVDTDPDWLVSELLSGSSIRIEDIVAPPRGEQLQRVWPEWVGRNGPDARPAVKEWAAYKGYDTEYDLKKLCGRGPRKGQGARVRSAQALQYPEALEAQLNKISQIARTAIEDSGANILYLAVGFLSWSEKDDSSKVIAPLFLVPVALESKGYDKDTRRKIYTLTHNGEDLQENLSLREKLKKDFSLNLPSLEDDDTVSSYLKRCQSLTRGKPNWQILHYATLGFFQFGKLLLYLDLDPKKWTKNPGLLGHPVIAKVLGSDEGEESGFEYAEPMSPDDLNTEAPEFKLVQSADSSQHSVVVDAAQGKSLVVEGPPGTGKSQTITNIIAVAMMKGQSVLFVSEKMAALDVVRRRLDSVGLGDFCLELHSHRTQRKKLLDDIETRIRRRRKRFPDDELQSALRRFKRHRNRLNRYAVLINSTVPGFLISVQSLFWQVAQLRSGGVADPEIAREFSSDQDLSQEYLEDAIYRLSIALRRRREIRADVGELDDHPFFGLTINREQIRSWQEAADALTILGDDLTRLRTKLQASAQFTRAPIPQTLRGAEPLARLAAVLDNPTDTGETVRLGAVIADNSSHAEFSDFVQFEADYARHRQGAETLWKSSVLDDPSALTGVIRVISKLGAGKVPTSDHSVDDLWRVAESARALVSLFESGECDFEEYTEALGFLFPSGLIGLAAADELFSILKATPLDALELRSPVLELIDDDVLLAKMEYEQSALRENASRLSLRFDIRRARELEALRIAASNLKKKSQMAGMFDAEWRASNALYRSVCLASPWFRSASKKASDLDAIADHFDSLSLFEGNSDYAGLLGKRFQGTETPVSSYRSLVAWNAAIRKWASKWFGNSLPIARAVMRIDPSRLECVRNLEGGGLQKTIQQVISNLKRMREICGAELDDDWFGSWSGGTAIAAAVADNLETSLPVISDQLLTSNVSMAKLVGDAKPYLKAALDQKRATARGKFIRKAHDKGPLLNHELERLRSACKFATAYWTDSSCSEAREIIRAALDEDCIAPLLESLRALAVCLKDYMERAAPKLDQLGARKEFFNQSTDMVDLDTAIQRCGRALEGGATFEAWAQLVSSLNPDENQGVPWPALAEAVVADRVSDEGAEATLRLGLFELVLGRVMSKHPELKEFEGVEHEEVRARLREVDGALLELHREEVACKAGSSRVPEGSSGSRVSDLTDMTLLRHEISKQRRHIPIRKLVNRASGALLALKPCFMMGPLSVAQYLEPGKVEFDLLIMDEASQMKPEDALGAIARARQVIVVGDPKQLPPTSFFDRIDDALDEDAEDAFIVEGKNSILELLMPTLGRVRQLNWHYRSRHESLIAFCNRQFYDDRLLAFPSPRKDAIRGSLGITYHYVSGEYGQQRNQIEAEHILRGVLKEIRSSGGHRTVGVVAINSQQAELLNENWLRLLREHPDVEALIAELPESEPFFIKNLENVQGDERDVIFISLTYGQDSKGHVYQRFGPINQQNGWRRLNVLFSRARENMVVFSSMRSDQITPSHGNLGATALKQFLGYCERGGRFETSAISTSRDPDSAFEIEVIGALEKRGFECVPQVGVAGFFIDIGIKDPESEGDYLIGIECDGATYHSAKSARDRDFLRQAILEGLGWEIHRIWSPDWFKRPEREIDRLARALDISLERARARREQRERTLAKVIHIGKADGLDSQGMATPNVSQEDETKLSQPATRCPDDIERKKRLSREGLREALFRLRQTIESEFPEAPIESNLLRDELVAFFTEHLPTSRQEFAEAVPVYMRQQIDLGTH